MPAGVAVPVVTLRDSAGRAVVVTIYDLLRVSANRAFMLTESVGKAFDLTKQQQAFLLLLASAFLGCCKFFRESLDSVRLRCQCLAN